MAGNAIPMSLGVLALNYDGRRSWKCLSCSPWDLRTMCDGCSLTIFAGSCVCV